MKTAQEIAEKTEDAHKFDRQYPVSKAAQQVINALGITVKINGASHANQIFDALGINVTSRREGRKSVPVVSAKKDFAQRNYGGDYDIAESPANHVDLSAIRHWMS